MNLIIDTKFPVIEDSNLPGEWDSFGSLIKSTYSHRSLRQVIRRLDYLHKRLLYIDE